MKPKQYKAKDLNGEWVHGWYVMLHEPIFDNHCMLVGWKDTPSLFNDDPGIRHKGTYWHTIDPETLEEYE